MTDLPVHVIHVFRRLGWKRYRQDLWRQIREDDTSRQELFDTLAIVPNPPVPYLLLDLLSCRICLSFHIAFWVAMFVYLFTDTDLTHAGLFLLSWPLMANVLMSVFRIMLREEERDGH